MGTRHVELPPSGFPNSGPALPVLPPVGKRDKRWASQLARMRSSSLESAVWWMQVRSVLEDILLLIVSVYTVFYLSVLSRTSGIRIAETFSASQREFLSSLFLFTTFTVLLFATASLYRFPQIGSSLQECRTVCWTTLLATLLLSGVSYVSGMKPVSQATIVGAGLLNCVTLAGWRLLKRRLAFLSRRQSKSSRNVLIVGAGRTGQQLARFLEGNQQLGYRVRGFLDQHDHKESRVLGRIEHLPEVARAHFVDEVLITSSAGHDLVSEVVVEARRNRLDVKIVPDLYDDLWDEPCATMPVEYVGKYPVLVLHRQPIPALGLFVKRALDIVLASLGLVLAFPAMLAIGIAIKLDSPGPALYTSTRLGRKGLHFAFFKFRTMVNGADSMKHRLRNANERQGPFFKLADDPRMTRLGRFLRKYSLDELPQLCNVLKGDMSLVGPRPHPLDDCELYRLEHLRRLDVTPGITGLWQISSRRDPSFEKSMFLDLQYIENWSLWKDFTILLRTLPAVLRAEGQ